MLIEDDSNNNLSPISSKTSLDSPPSLPIDLNLLHQPVQLQNDEQINFVDSTSPMSIDEDRNRTISPISIDLPHSGFEPKSSSNSEIFSSCYNLDEGNYPFEKEKEKEKEKKITADHEEMQLNSLSLSTPRTSPNHNLVSSSSYKEGVAITEQFTKKADFRLKLGKKTSSDTNRVSNDSDSNSLHFLPSPTQSIHYDTSSSIYRNSSFFSLSSLTSTPVQDDQSDQEVPFTIALHYFQAWLHHHLVLTETQCLYYFFKFTRPQLYVPWIQRYFLMQDATFRDQLSNLLFSESILFVISDPHGLATRLNIILEHEPSLSFVFHKEKIPSLSQGKVCYY
ncbi:hypothetical protein HMI56_005484 [Coelomomyces lativittatus]|nr:hypothetical protein HMI56_005484 [Coelomomyces lativittatus]